MEIWRVEWLVHLSISLKRQAVRRKEGKEKEDPYLSSRKR